MGEHLLDFGKVRYRHQEALPRWFELRKDQVTNKRSATQIRRIIKSWMIESNDDQRTSESTRKRPLGWTAMSNINKDQKTTSTISYGPSDVIAYAHYKMNERFMILRRVFEEIRWLMPNFIPVRILDFGCGPGISACAAVDVWEVRLIRVYSLSGSCSFDSFHSFSSRFFH